MAKRCPFFASTFVLNEVMQVEFFESFEPRFLWLGVVFHSQSHSDRRSTRGIKRSPRSYGRGDCHQLVVKLPLTLS